MTTRPKSKSAPRLRVRKIRTIAKGLAQTTLMAAAFAAAQLSPGEREPDTKLFNMSIVDKLTTPLTRFRE